MSQQKRFAPTSRKLRKARKDGDVAKSRDLAAVFLLPGGAAILWFYNEYRDLISFAHSAWSGGQDFHTNTVLVYAYQSARVLIGLVWLFFLVIFLIVFVVESFQVGFCFSVKTLAFDLSRLSFVNGLRRMLGLEVTEAEGSAIPGVFYEVFKTVILVSCLCCLGGLCALAAVRSSLGEVFQQASDIVTFVELYCGATLGGFLIICSIAAWVDYARARKKRFKRLAMDLEELRRDLRESEGDPELRGMRKLLHQELALHGLLEGVRKARVLVVDREGR